MTGYTGPLSVLPPEMHEAIFNHLDDEEVATLRRVCRHWRSLLEAFYNIYIEMRNDNWEDFLRHTTAMKLHICASDLTFPIYLTSFFPDFALRIRVLEFTGFTPVYNLINILSGCKLLESLTILDVRMGRTGKIPYPGEHKNFLRLKKLNIGPSSWDIEIKCLLSVSEILGNVIQSNTMRELNLSSAYAVETTLNRIYQGKLGDPGDEDDADDEANVIAKYDHIFNIMNQQWLSLRRIQFKYVHGVLPQRPRLYLKFHAPTSSAEKFSIRKSCLFRGARFYNSQPTHSLQREIEPRELLDLYKTQSRMENLKVVFENENELLLIGFVVKKNGSSLKKVEITSVERISQDPRKFDASIFSPCPHLTKLSLKCEMNNRFNHFINLELLPPSILKLQLAGFIPLLPSEENQESGRCRILQKLASLTLDHLPWFFVGGKDVRVFRVKHFQFMLRLFPKLRKLRLISIIHQRFVTPNLIQTIGIDYPKAAVSDELISWCGSGGKGLRISARNNYTPDKLTHLITIAEDRKCP